MVPTHPSPSWMRRAVVWAPVLLLGPVTGPLLALSAISFRKRRPIVGALALAGIATFWLGAPAVLAAELRMIGAPTHVAAGPLPATGKGMEFQFLTMSKTRSAAAAGNARYSY